MTISAPTNETAQFALGFAGMDDLSRLVELHLGNLGPQDNFATRLGPAFVRSVYQWFLSSPTTFVIVARSRGGIIGFTAVSDAPYTGPMLRACREDAVRAFMRRPWLALHPELLQRLWRSIFRSAATSGGDKMAQVAFTVVSAEHRGQGVGGKLKRASINECRRRGSRGLLTGVRRDNVASRTMNERAGFEEVAALGTRRFSYYVLRFDEEVAMTEDSGIGPLLASSKVWEGETPR